MAFHIYSSLVWIYCALALPLTEAHSYVLQARRVVMGSNVGDSGYARGYGRQKFPVCYTLVLIAF